MMSRSRQEPDLVNSTSTRHVTMAPNVGPRQISTELPFLPCICKSADGTGHRLVDDTRSIQVSDPKHRCEREHLDTHFSD